MTKAPGKHIYTEPHV